MCVCPQSQEKEARDEMKRRAKELQIARKEASKRGGRGGAYNVGGGFGSSDYNPGPSVGMSASHQPSKPAYNPPRYIHTHNIVLSWQQQTRRQHCSGEVIVFCMYFGQ